MAELPTIAQFLYRSCVTGSLAGTILSKSLHMPIEQKTLFNFTRDGCQRAPRHSSAMRVSLRKQNISKQLARLRVANIAWWGRSACWYATVVRITEDLIVQILLL